MKKWSDKCSQDICEVFVFDPEKVERMKKECEATRGLALFFKALADDTRLKVVYALAREELCVCDVATMLGITVQAASHHLRYLRNMGLAKYRKEGKIVFYTLRNRRLADFVIKVVRELKEAGGDD